MLTALWLIALLSFCEGNISTEPKADKIWILSGQPLILSCSGSNKLAWYNADGIVNGGNDIIISEHQSNRNGREYHETTLSIHEVRVSDTGTYNCTDGKSFRTKTVKVVQGQLSIKVPDRVIAFDGDSIALICHYEGNVKVKVDWHKNNGEDPSKEGFVSRKRTFRRKNYKTTLTTSKNKLEVTDSGIYYCQAGPLVKKFTLEVIKTDSCENLLVTGSHGVDDSVITASTFYKDILYDDSPYCAKLDHPLCGGWSPTVNDDNQWIQVSFPNTMVVRKVVTQGRKPGDLRQEWVTKYQILYSLDGTTWTTYTLPDDNTTVFDANTDQETIVTTQLPIPFVAKYVRLHPTGWHKKISLRFDLQGCMLPTSINATGGDKGVHSIQIPEPMYLSCNLSGPRLPNIVWYKDKTRLLPSSGYVQMVNTTWFGDRIETVAALQKSDTKFEDSGVYQCVDTLTKLNRSITVTAAQLDMMPSYSQYWLPKYHKFEISCEYMGIHSSKITWSCDKSRDLQASGYHVTSKTKIVNGVTTIKSTIVKEQVMMADTCNISCSVGSLSRLMELKIMNKKKIIHNLTPDEKIVLKCNIEDLQSKSILDIYWTKNTVPLSMLKNMAGKFMCSADKDLITIQNPDITMAGLYECNIVLKAGNGQSQHITVPTEIHAKPEIVLEGQSNVRKGDTLHLYCKVSGYPVPKVLWVKDDHVIVSSDNRHNFQALGDVPNGHLTVFDVNEHDKGKYKCRNSHQSDNSTSPEALQFISVKENFIMDNFLLICLVLVSSLFLVSMICCIACWKHRRKPERLKNLPASRYSQPLLIRQTARTKSWSKDAVTGSKRYVDIEVKKDSQSLTSLEEIDKLPLPPPPVDRWEGTSTCTLDDSSLTYERIPKLRIKGQKQEDSAT